MCSNWLRRRPWSGLPHPSRMAVRGALRRDWSAAEVVVGPLASTDDDRQRRAVWRRLRAYRSLFSLMVHNQRAPAAERAHHLDVLFLSRWCATRQWAIDSSSAFTEAQWLLEGPPPQLQQQLRALTRLPVSGSAHFFFTRDYLAVATAAWQPAAVAAFAAAHHQLHDATPWTVSVTDADYARLEATLFPFEDLLQARVADDLLQRSPVAAWWRSVARL